VFNQTWRKSAINNSVRWKLPERDLESTRGVLADADAWTWTERDARLASGLYAAEPQLRDASIVHAHPFVINCMLEKY